MCPTIFEHAHTQIIFLVIRPNARFSKTPYLYGAQEAQESLHVPLSGRGNQLRGGDNG
jgi:hypothetical protein